MSDEQHQEPWYGDKWKGNETVSRFKDRDTLIEAFLNTKTKLGEVSSKMGNMIELPKEATPETVRPVLGRFGLPEAPEGYKLPDNPQAKRLSAAFHEAGLLPFQAERLIREVTALSEEHGKTEQAKADEAAKKAEEELKAEWGEKAGEYEEILSRFAADKESIAVQAYEKLLGQDPKLAKKLAVQLAAKPVRESKGPPSTPPGTREGAIAEIKRIKNEYVESRKVGKEHWFGSPNQDQQKYLDTVYTLASEQK